MASNILITVSLLVLLGGAAPGAFAQIPGAVPAEPTMTTYENAELDFSIQHSAAWIPVEGTPAASLDDAQQGVTTTTVSFVTLPEDPQDQFGESVSVIVDEMTLTFDVNQYTAARLPVLPTAFTDVNITQELANVTLAGRPAYQVIFDATLNATLSGEPIDGRVMEIWTVVNNNTAYTIHYEAERTKFDQFLTQANQMIESFMIGHEAPSNDTGAPAANATETTTAETPAGNASGLEAARQQLLSAWQETPFSAFSTFIEPASDFGYGVYTEHGSSVFNPDDTVTLYLEPVGFSHNHVLGELGEELYQINLTASVQITPTDPSATALLNQTISDIPPIVINSHRQNTELYMTIPVYLYQADQVPEGEYTILYTITDGETGESFTIEKAITIAQTVAT